MNLNAKKALKEYRAKIESGEIEKPQKLNPIEKAKANPKSLRAAITAKCWDCCCEDRKEVTFCTATNCPLWDVRPWQPKGGQA